MRREASHTTNDGPLGVPRVLTRQRSPQAAVAELGQAALGGAEFGDVFDLAVGLACEVLDAEFAKILHQPSVGQPFVLVAGRGWGDHIHFGETTVPCDQGSQAGYTLTVSQPVRVDDLREEGRFSGPPLLTDHAVVGGLSVVIPGEDRAYGVLGVHTRQRRTFTDDDGDFLRSVANILGSTVQNEKARQQIEEHSRLRERRLRYQEAIATCARTLLASSGDSRLELAIEALLKATQATYVFVERNVMDPELGFCSRTVAEAEESDTVDGEQDSDYWTLVPWDRMPTSRSYLEIGEPVVLIPDQLEGIEFEQYAADPYPVKSEMNIPIFAEDRWVGLIGFSDSEILREWTEEDLSLLTTAATMIGAFWERETARQALEDLIRSKDEFLASVSHELRTPLTAVVGFAEVLQNAGNTLSEEKQVRYLQTMVRQGKDLANIVDDLLVAAKAGVGNLHVTLIPTNLRAQAAQVLEAFEQDQVAHIELLGDPVTAVGDPDRVRQILRNFISNALRYGGNTVQVRVLSDDSSSKVLVCDNGIAIPEAEREVIFRPYQRAHNAPGLVGSVGLGLAISRQLARLMGGDVTYRHENGESIFELALPRAD